MTKFSKYAALAVTFGFFAIFMFFLYIFLIKDKYSTSEMMPLIAIIIVMAVLFVVFLVLSIKHRNDPEDSLIRARRLRLARTEGNIISGLPFVTTPFAEINLFRDKIEFVVTTNMSLSNSNTQIFNLDLSKITRVSRQTGSQNTRITSLTTGNTKVSNSFNNDRMYNDILVLEYIDNDEEKQIIVNLSTLMSGISKFMAEYEKLRPQSQQPIEL